MDWPDDLVFADHAAWQPEWTSNRPRVMWYLTFEHAPALQAAAASLSGAFVDAGADVIPTNWLHLTVTHVGFADEIDEWSLRASRSAVSNALAEQSPLTLQLGPASVVPDAVVWTAEPVDQLDRLHTQVRTAMSGVGVDPPDIVDGVFWPHVSLCYLNGRTDHARLWAAVRDAHTGPLSVRCDRLTQVLVTRADGHYRWEVLDEIPLRGADVFQQAQGAGWR